MSCTCVVEVGRADVDMISSLGTFFEAGMLPKVTASDPAGMDSLSLWLIEPNTMGDPELAIALLTTVLGCVLFTVVAAGGCDRLIEALLALAATAE